MYHNPNPTLPHPHINPISPKCSFRYNHSTTHVPTHC